MKEEQKPGLESKPFTIIMNEYNSLKKDWLYDSGDAKLQVLELPYQKWYSKLFQFLTFGYYKAGWHYKVKLVNSTT